MQVRFFFFLSFLLSSFAFAQAQHGFVEEGLIIKSKILNKDVRYTVYLPYDYKDSQRYYPVVYLLHGFSDNDSGWVQFGEANLRVDKAIQNLEIPPMILIMPDGGVSWYVNNFDGSVKYEDFFIKELMPTVEQKFRIRSERRYRGIAGLSMGGFGTLFYLFKHPDLFSAGAAFSAAVLTKEWIGQMDNKAWKNLFGEVYGEKDADKRIDAHLKSTNPLMMLETLSAEDLKGGRIYLDCGDDDFLSVANAKLHILLSEKKIPHEYRVRNGSHQWEYWRTGLIDGLKFIGKSFHQ